MCCGLRWGKHKNRKVLRPPPSSPLVQKQLPQERLATDRRYGMGVVEIVLSLFE